MSPPRCCGSTRDGCHCRFTAKFEYKGDTFCGIHKCRGAELIDREACEGKLKDGRECRAPSRDLVDSHFYCARHSPRDKECPICFCNMTVATTRELEECHHRFHKACLAKWIAQGGATCPICRARLTIPTDAATSSLDDYFHRAMFLTAMTAMSMMAEPEQGVQRTGPPFTLSQTTTRTEDGGNDLQDLTSSGWSPWLPAGYMEGLYNDGVSTPPPVSSLSYHMLAALSTNLPPA